MSAAAIGRVGTAAVMADPFLKGEAFMSSKKRPLVEKMNVSEELKEYIRTSRTLVPDLVGYLRERGDDVEKLTINFAGNDKQVPEEYDDVMAIIRNYPQMSVVSGGIRNIEITKSGVSKASALMWLGKYLGIDRSEMIAFGDSENDLEMLRVAGVGVAMANAEEEVKEAADFVTLSNTENGIVHALQKFSVVG